MFREDINPVHLIGGNRVIQCISMLSPAKTTPTTEGKGVVQYLYLPLSLSPSLIQLTTWGDGLSHISASLIAIWRTLFTSCGCSPLLTVAEISLLQTALPGDGKWRSMLAIFSNLTGQVQSAMGVTSHMIAQNSFAIFRTTCTEKPCDL